MPELDPTENPDEDDTVQPTALADIPAEPPTQAQDEEVPQ